MDMEKVLAAYNAGHDHKTIQDYFDAHDLGDAPRPPIERGWSKVPLSADEPWISDDPNVIPTHNAVVMPDRPVAEGSPGVLTDTEHLPWNRSSVIGSNDMDPQRIIEPNSQEDVITNAVQNGASWDQVSDYVGENQDDTDKLINTKIDSGVPLAGSDLPTDFSGAF